MSVSDFRFSSFLDSIPDSCTDSFIDILQVLRRHDPGAPALTLLRGLKEELRWSYQQLLQTAQGFRHALQAAGVGPGASVCVIADNSPHFIALFLACYDMGCCFVPLHPDQRAETITGVLRQLRPALVIVDEVLQGVLLRSVLETAGRTWRLRIHRTPWLRPVLGCAVRRHQPVAINIASNACASSGTTVDVASEAAPPVLLLHSSGSTGIPKVIGYTRPRLNLFLHWQRRLFDAFPDVPATKHPSPRVNALPLAHFGGLSFVLQALLDGRTVHLPRAIAPEDYLALAVREHCQLLMLVPALYEALLCTAEVSLFESSLRYCLTMGEAVTAQLITLIERRLGVRVYSAYGMSEGLSGLSHHASDIPPDSCGRRLFGEIKLVNGIDDTDSNEGELWVRNETTAPCYSDPQLNAEKFVDGWYRTGDRLRCDALGFFYFLGRVDAMCVVNGRNVYPADVEQVLLGHADVIDCMAAGFAVAKGKQRLGVMVCLRADSRQTAAGLVDWFLEHGPLHATPAWLLLAKAIPRNLSDKRDRLAVAALLEQEYRACLRKVS